jgi:Tol biopolymer transport system component
MWRWLLPIVAVALTGCSERGLRLPQSPLLAALERKSGLIAYVGPDGNVYTIDQGGGNQSKITEDAHPVEEGVRRFYDFPTWSAADNKLAFVGFEIGQDGRTTAGIFTAEPEDQPPVEVYSSDQHLPFYLYWSPNGEWVSFLSSSPGSNSMAMQLASAQGGETSLIDTGRPYYWAWAPEGMQVLAHVGGSSATNPGAARISFLEMDPFVRAVGLRIEPTSFQAPAYSPDGEYVLFGGDSGDGQPQLVLADSAGEVLRSLADYNGSIAFSWAPRGDYAAYLSGDTSSQALIGDLTFVDLRRPDEPQHIKTDAERVLGFFWAPDGKTVAYFVPVMFSNAAEGEEQTAENSQFLLELHIAEARSGNTRRIAAFQPTQTFLNIFPFFDQYQRSVTIWSPDSNYLVVSAVASEEQQGLFIVPASGDYEPRFLAEGNVGFWSWK